MRSQRSREGYLLIDNRHAAGPGGVSYLEAATSTCSHCHRQVIRNPQRVRERAFCFKCSHYICDQCAATQTCIPFAKLIEDISNGQA